MIFWGGSWRVSVRVSAALGCAKFDQPEGLHWLGHDGVARQHGPERIGRRQPWGADAVRAQHPGFRAREEAQATKGEHGGEPSADATDPLLDLRPAHLAHREHQQGLAQAVVSAGNSGAMLACGLLVLGRVKGVERPGIIVTFPTLDASRPNGYGECALLDMGANVECKASHLAQFAVLGATFARHSLGRERPRVGLLANGEEETKGTEVLREAYGLLSRPLPLAPDDAPPGLRSAHPGAPDFEFVGFVEGRDIFEFRRPAAPGVPGALGGLDVVVTDGFTGNVVLKTAEGAANLLGQSLRRAAEALRVQRPRVAEHGGLRTLAGDAVDRDGHREERVEGLQARLEALACRKDDMLTIAELGIDQLIVDEAGTVQTEAVFGVVADRADPLIVRHRQRAAGDRG